jgi:hypothetical protein
MFFFFFSFWFRKSRNLGYFCAHDIKYLLIIRYVTSGVGTYYLTSTY